MDSGAAQFAAGAGSTRAVVEALLAAVDDASAVLGVVVDTQGSTYAKAGALICLREGVRVGWISGGCLETSLEEAARAFAADGNCGLIEFDTTDEADLFFGTRIGCRGVVRLALVLLRSVGGIGRVLRAWIDGAGDIELAFEPAGRLVARAGDVECAWALDWSGAAEPSNWQLRVAAAPRVLVFGAGPESPALLPWLRRLGWYVDLVERRAMWTPALTFADRGLETTPAPALEAVKNHDAALVMNHDFELDRETLEALAETEISWIGLLGPPARRDDLLRLLGSATAEALRARLHAPVGLALGGRGPEAIALAIAAELHSHWNAAARSIG